MEKKSYQQASSESKTRLVEQIKLYLHSGDYSRALDLLRGTAVEFSGDTEFSELEKRAHEGVKRNAEANRLITESQELFAQAKSVEAIQLLRAAYELDKSNSLARTILANALVEHARSMVETNWLEAEKLAKQALDLNPAHPTAKTIRTLVLEWKNTSAVEDWVSQASTLQSSGDLFAALAWVAEGLAVHPDDPKLLHIQDAILRDQAARRRQSRRRDLEDLRSMEKEVDGAADVAAKQSLAERIQGVAAKYWTDGEILSIANGLLRRLGLAPQESSTASLQSNRQTVIFHVPRAGTTKPPSADTSPAPSTSVSPTAIPPTSIPREHLSKPTPSSDVATSIVPLGKIPTPSAEQSSTSPAVKVPAAQPVAAVAKVTPASTPSSQSARSGSLKWILISAAAFTLVAAIFLARNHPAPPRVTTQSAPPAGEASAISGKAISEPVPVPGVSDPAVSTTPPHSIPASPSASQASSETAKVAPPSETPDASDHDRGTLVIVAGEDDASVFLNGKLQPQLTHAGQLRLQDLELKDYVVQISKSGFQDPPQQKVRIRKSERAVLTFKLKPQNLQAQPRLASLSIQGGMPGAKVLLDQTPVGTVQPDGTLSLSLVPPGDHTVELQKDRFESRQFKKHFGAGETISLAASEAALEPAPGELKISFAPADARVAIAKGEFLKMVSSGVPFTLPAGTYTLTARTAEKFTRSSTLEVQAGQSKALDLSLAPDGMSKWDDSSAWKREGDSYIRKGGDFVLYGVVPASGTFVFSAMLSKGRVLQWVLNYSDPKNYILIQMDDDYFYRAVVRNGEKTDEIKVANKSDKRSFRTLQIRVGPTELVHQIKHGDGWTILDRWTKTGANLNLGKFGFYLPGNDEVSLSSFAHYVDLNFR